MARLINSVLLLLAVAATVQVKIYMRKLHGFFFACLSGAFTINIDYSSHTKELAVIETLSEITVLRSKSIEKLLSSIRAFCTFHSREYAGW